MSFWLVEEIHLTFQAKNFCIKNFCIVREAIPRGTVPPEPYPGTILRLRSRNYTPEKSFEILPHMEMYNIYIYIFIYIYIARMTGGPITVCQSRSKSRSNSGRGGGPGLDCRTPRRSRGLPRPCGWCSLENACFSIM